jgi:hypothetical protein
MLNEEELEKQKKISEIIKKYIKPDLLSKNWDADGLLVTI